MDWFTRGDNEVEKAPLVWGEGNALGNVWDFITTTLAKHGDLH
jgi:hypothetical protein